MQRTYMDNNATTPLDPSAIEVMRPYIEEHFGNPSSAHRFGETARDAIESAREKVAALLGAHPSRIIFSSCGTESNNQAIWSAALAQLEKKHILASQVEHASVLAPLSFLEKIGYEVEFFPVDATGGLDLDRLKESVRDDTALVSFMAANNETGVLWPLDEIGEICHEKGVLFHSDGVQMAGKEVIHIEKMPVDYFTVSAHKLHGPKGIGALFTKRSSPLSPLLMGGGQERGMRSGTENVSAIVGFGAAAEKALEFLPRYREEIGRLRERIEVALQEKFPDSVIHGRQMPRLANTVNISFRYLSAAAIVQDLDEKGFAVSAHSACHGGDLDPSHVLKAMHVPEDYIHGVLRISLSRFTTSSQVEALLTALFASIEKR